MAPVETWGNSQVVWPQFFQEPSRRKLREWGGQPKAYSTINQCLGFLAVKRVLFSATVIKHRQTSRERTCVCFKTSSCTCTSVEAAWFQSSQWAQDLRYGNHQHHGPAPMPSLNRAHGIGGQHCGSPSRQAAQLPL